MNTNSLQYEILKYRGHKLQYIDENGKEQSRTLVGISWNSRTNEPEAEFKYSILTRLGIMKKKVPLSRVLLPNTQEDTMGRRRETGNKSSSYQTRDTSSVSPTPPGFNYYDKYYHINVWENFKAGDEVVWTKYSKKQDPCLGRIMVTAQKETVMGLLELVAVVRLEKAPESINGINPPNQFVYKRGITNTYLIPDKEILKLDEWIMVNTEKDEEQKQDGRSEEEWQTVTKRRKGGRKGDKERPQTEFFPEGNHQYNAEEDVRPRRQSIDAIDHNLLPYTNHAPQYEEKDWKQPIEIDKFSTRIRHLGGHGVGVGIQGNKNSCYLDSSISALFCFADTLDQYLLNETPDNATSNQIKEILRNDVICKLRWEPYYVTYRSTRKLRKIFARNINQEYLSQFMDVEDFLVDLFKLMEIPPFLFYDNEESDHIHQIALPFTWDVTQHANYLSLQFLLENSFKTFEVKLEKLPENIFVIKLPVSNGVLIPCNGVIPNLTLDLKNLVKPGNSTCVMNLQAVICLRENHFVTFVRTSKALNSPWVYMDSKPTIQMPYVQILPDVDHLITRSLHELENNNDPGAVNLYTPECKNISLFQHAYICIYA